MSQRKNWTLQEDQILKQAVLSYSDRNLKIRWKCISEHMASLEHGLSRSGKQCRERWYNHLKFSGTGPQAESSIDIEMLIRLVGENGKKWAVIAKEFPGRSQNRIKNFFYLSLKKGLKSLRTYNSKFRQQKIYRVLNDSLLQKIFLLQEGGEIQKIKILSCQAKEYGERILANLLRSSKVLAKLMANLPFEEKQIFEILNEDIKQFSKICKYRKKERTKLYKHQNHEGFTLSSKITRFITGNEKRNPVRIAKINPISIRRIDKIEETNEDKKSIDNSMGELNKNIERNDHDSDDNLEKRRIEKSGQHVEREDGGKILQLIDLSLYSPMIRERQHFEFGQQLQLATMLL